MPLDKSLKDQQPPATSTETGSRETAPPTTSLFEGTEHAGTEVAGSDKTEHANSGQSSYRVFNRAYPLNPPPKEEKSFTDDLAEEVLPNLGFTKLEDPPAVLSTDVGLYGQDQSLVSRNGAPRRYGTSTYWCSGYDECEDSSLMFILVARHEEVIAHPSKSGPQLHVYFSRRHLNSIEDYADQVARLGVLRKEILDEYKSQAASQNEVSSPSCT
ncbi:hypothetical protein FFLO_00473 [Filobasidium floriforme]|uniref:Uncharacterized protein n=1 Tax=Filobasidium floriforme TaxID=5210 RepID=A0A8K0JT17_9TREE|nr:uncharacterized protein HD553DRAFT_345766 [Filobasidium floriforme]KAG7575309.1 hypothetical protein FFLO_00473 [Filobasidium floriforme]KAH8078898.1 hypothetical protein HD553DRAFT_345766 [Filobasidium floriforme]